MDLNHLRRCTCPSHINCRCSASEPWTPFKYTRSSSTVINVGHNPSANDIHPEADDAETEYGFDLEHLHKFLEWHDLGHRTNQLALQGVFTVNGLNNLDVEDLKRYGLSTSEVEKVAGAFRSEMKPSRPQSLVDSGLGLTTASEADDNVNIDVNRILRVEGIAAVQEDLAYRHSTTDYLVGIGAQSGSSYLAGMSTEQQLRHNIYPTILDLEDDIALDTTKKEDTSTQSAYCCAVCNAEVKAIPSSTQRLFAILSRARAESLDTDRLRKVISKLHAVGNRNYFEKLQLCLNCDYYKSLETDRSNKASEDVPGLQTLLDQVSQQAEKLASLEIPHSSMPDAHYEDEKHQSQESTYSHKTEDSDDQVVARDDRVSESNGSKQENEKSIAASAGARVQMEAVRVPGTGEVGSMTGIEVGTPISDAGSEDSWQDVLWRMLESQIEGLVDEAMNDYYSIYAPASDGNDTSSGSGTVGPSNAGSENTLRSNNTKLTTPQKRSYSPNNEDDEEEEDDRPKKRPRKPTGRKPKLPRFACPYFKHDPQTYANRSSCSGPGWQDVHRVKEHIHRCHAQRSRCPRCQNDFDTQVDLIQHLSGTPRCKKVSRSDGLDDQGPDGIDQEQAAKLREKAKPGKNDIEKWNDIYRILFGDVSDVEIPGPFYDYSTSTALTPSSDAVAQFREMCFRELPGILRQMLGERVQDELVPIPGRLAGLLPNFVRDGQELIARRFAETAETTLSVADISPQSLLQAQSSSNGNVQLLVVPRQVPDLQHPTIEDMPKSSSHGNDSLNASDSAYYSGETSLHQNTTNVAFQAAENGDAIKHYDNPTTEGGASQTSFYQANELAAFADTGDYLYDLMPGQYPLQDFIPDLNQDSFVLEAP